MRKEREVKLEGGRRCDSEWKRRRDGEKEKTKEICQWGGEVERLN